jgi:hypothetical protein
MPKPPKTKLISYLAIVVLILGVVSTGIGVTVRHSHRVETQAAMTTPPFTMRSNQTSFGIGGNTPYLNATKVRFQKSDGSWKEVTTYYKRDGSVSAINKQLAITGVGVFEIHDDIQTLVFLSPKKHAMHLESEDDLRKDPEYARDDVVFGYKVIVQHNSPKGTNYDDIYRAPALGGAILKVVFGETGSSGYTVIEPTKIDLGEPSESEFAIPDYPFNYTFYEEQIKGEESQGHQEVASKMREVVAQHKQQFAKPAAR